MSYKSELQSNNVDLQTILDTVNALPEATEPEVEGIVISDTVSRTCLVKLDEPESGSDWTSIATGGTYSCEWSGQQLHQTTSYNFMYEHLAWVMMQPSVSGNYPVIIIPRDSEATVRVLRGTTEYIMKGRIVQTDTTDGYGHDWKVALDFEVVSGPITLYYSNWVSSLVVTNVNSSEGI